MLMLKNDDFYLEPWDLDLKFYAIKCRILVLLVQVKFQQDLIVIRLRLK